MIKGNNMIRKDVKYAKLSNYDFLDGEKCVICNSTKTTWVEISGVEVAYKCKGCNNGFMIEICFLSQGREEKLKELL